MGHERGIFRPFAETHPRGSTPPWCPLSAAPLRTPLHLSTRHPFQALQNGKPARAHPPPPPAKGSKTGSERLRIWLALLACVFLAWNLSKKVVIHSIFEILHHIRGPL
jgi:hypothetical protein